MSKVCIAKTNFAHISYLLMESKRSLFIVGNVARSTVPIVSKSIMKVNVRLTL